jgi:hypothetical protein
VGPVVSLIALGYHGNLGYLGNPRGATEDAFHGKV